MLLKPQVPTSKLRRLSWHQLYGSAAALALAEATRADQRLYVVVTDDARELERLSSELQFFAGERLPLLTLPDWEVLPYDLFSPHPDITSQRLRTLFELPRVKAGCLIVAADVLMQRLPPRNYVQGRAFELAVGEPLELEPFRQRLIEAGYVSVSQVASPGEYAVRGSLFDVYPMGTSAPLRIDLFDNEIEAIRRFDPDTQRSLDSLERIRLLPAREIPLDPDSVREFRRRFRTRFEGDPTRATIYRGVSEGIAPAGIEFYVPLFFDETATLFDYLPANAVLVHDAALPGALSKAWHDVEARYEDRRHDIERPVLPPGELFISPEEIDTRLALFASITLNAFKADTELQGGENIFNFPSSAPSELRIDAHAEHPFAPLDLFLNEFDGRVLIAADSPGRREVLQEMLRGHGYNITPVAGWDAFAQGDTKLALTVAPALQGLTLTDPRIAVISEGQLFGQRARQERQRRKRAAADPEAILRDLQDLNPGAPVVHQEYGVGRYVGLQVMDIAGQSGEFLVLEYLDG
ncbi:MAG: transcription-repair coupling factor, partial [Sinobacteraceae bacterium]|nr:transcription-repair coupling factor [Nevskiaceae bacterium]